MHGLIPLPAALEHRFAPPRRWRFDYAWIESRVALEIEGGLWQYGRHNRPASMIKDMEKYNEAAILGWCVIRVTPDQLKRGIALTLVERALKCQRLLVV